MKSKQFGVLIVVSKGRKVLFWLRGELIEKQTIWTYSNTVQHVEFGIVSVLLDWTINIHLIEREEKN